jgi:hypothetical protein
MLLSFIIMILIILLFLRLFHPKNPFINDPIPLLAYFLVYNYIGIFLRRFDIFLPLPLS